MGKYRAEVDWSGYSRGISVYEIEAESSEEALEIIRDGGGNEIDRFTVRDDTENMWEDATVSRLEMMSAAYVLLYDWLTDEGFVWGEENTSGT